MNTRALINRFLLHWPSTEIFTTRMLLRFGTRAAIDNATYIMVKSGIIRRLVGGVFVLAECKKTFSNLEVATVKAHSFGRKIIPHPAGRDTDRRAYQAGRHPHNQTIYGISGRSSSFQYAGRRIYFLALVSRKAALQESKVGRAVASLWHIGSNHATDKDIEDTAQNWKRTDKLELANLCEWVPAWIMDHYIEWIAPEVALFMRKNPRGTPA